MSKALAHTIISYEEFILIRNYKKAQGQWKVKEVIQKEKLVEDGKRIGIDEMIKQNEKMIIQNRSLQLKICKQQ